MTTRTLLEMGACAQAQAIAQGHCTSGALLQAQYAAIAERDPRINAFLALAQPPVSPLDGTSSLAGTSFAVKDNIDVQGLPTASGLRVTSRLAEQDAPAVARLRAAGLHPIGKLNMHPMALGASNHNPDYGDCFHPHTSGHSPGGSSGGSAAAVAAGFCSIALGTDTMGSVRLPSAYCGVVGFKPSHDLLGLEGVVTLCRLLDHVGVLARAVEDIQAAMQLLAPHAPQASAPARPRLGYVVRPETHGATPEVVQAYAAGLQRLREHLDADWVPIKLAGVEPGKVRRSGLLLCEAELHPLLAPWLEGDALPRDLQQMLRYIERKTAIDIGQALQTAAAAGEYLTTLTADLDALVLPTTPQTTFPMDGPVPANQAEFTVLANMNGAPAISLPLPVAANALPVGLQLIGHRGHDHRLLAMSSAVEAALRRKD